MLDFGVHICMLNLLRLLQYIHVVLCCVFLFGIIQNIHSSEGVEVSIIFVISCYEIFRGWDLRLLSCIFPKVTFPLDWREFEYSCFPQSC